MPKRTPLYEAHVKLGAKMIDFGGWEMPVSYSGIIQETQAVRNSAGLFDVGHMGIVEFSGKGALPFLQKVTTNDASKLEDFKAQYSILCNEKGGVVDDILVYKLPEKFMLVLNASNTEKDLAWLNSFSSENAKIDHKTNMHIISIQGPKSELILSGICDIKLTPLKHTMFRMGSVLRKKCIISRTGYTGEDGFELFLDEKDLNAVWAGVLVAGKEHGLLPCGLGARDCLRIEAGLPLYGHEYSDELSPIEAGYGWAVKPEKGDFIGRVPLSEQKSSGPAKKLVGIVLEEKAIPRNGCGVFSNAEGSNRIGEISSGTFSPTLNKSIGMAYVDAGSVAEGQRAYVGIRNRSFGGKIIKLPFYRRKS